MELVKKTDENSYNNGEAILTKFYGVVMSGGIQVGDATITETNINIHLLPEIIPKQTLTEQLQKRL